MPKPRPPKIFFSAGEPSGDIHGANLIRQLQSRCPEVRVVGLGGPSMAMAGCHLLADLTALAVMWFGRVLLNFHKFWALYKKADRYFAQYKPDAVVLIDYPGFNWWIARAAKRHGIPVFYFMPPQIWAWARWRVEKMRRLVDHVLCSLPFEEEWFRSHGCHATFIGHPFFDEVRRHDYDEAFIATQAQRPGPLVVILPGSRTQEVTGNVATFLAAARRVHNAVPQARFAMACFKPQHADYARAKVAESGLAVDVYCRRTPELMRLADCCMAVSGSVSLELLYHVKPTVIHYGISRLAYFVQGFFRKVKYITLVNLLSTNELYPTDLTPYDPGQPDADRVLFPEYLTCEDKSAAVAGHVIEWLTKPAVRAHLVQKLQALKARVADEGASCKAAEYILAAVAPRHPAIARPHILTPRTQFSAPARGKVE